MMNLSQAFTQHYMSLDPEPHAADQPASPSTPEEEYEVPIDATTAKKIASEIEQLEGCGYRFEGAEASVAVLMRRAAPNYRPTFHLENLRVVVDSQGQGHEAARATVSIRVKDTVVETTGHGNGPIAAMDCAMRPYFPQLENSRLADYRVRTLDADSGTSAIARVMIDFKDGNRRWTTVGASPNIIEASCKALKDAYEYAILESARASRVLFAAG